MDNHTINRILIPIDLSESSLNAFESALVIAEKNKADVAIVYVRDYAFDIPGYQATFSSSKLSDNSEDVLNALADAAHHKTGKKTNLVLEEGPVSACIVKTAERYGCDLIVIGTHGASGFREYFIGTNTYNVIKHAPCPVLTIPTKKKCKVFNNIFFPLKPLHGAFKRYDLAHCLTSNEETSLHVLCLSNNKEDDDEPLITYLVNDLKEKLTGEQIKISTQYSFGNSIDEIVLKTADKVRADLVLLTPSIDITTKQFFIGPYTQRILHHAKTPVLIVKRTN